MQRCWIAQKSQAWRGGPETRSGPLAPRLLSLSSASLRFGETLIYTRTAALAARDAVDKARNATAAAVLGAQHAETGVTVTREIGKAQTRAYVHPRAFDFITEDNKPIR